MLRRKSITKRPWWSSHFWEGVGQKVEFLRTYSLQYCVDMTRVSNTYERWLCPNGHNIFEQNVLRSTMCYCHGHAEPPKSRIHTPHCQGDGGTGMEYYMAGKDPTTAYNSDCLQYVCNGPLVLSVSQHEPSSDQGPAGNEVQQRASTSHDDAMHCGTHTYICSVRIQIRSRVRTHRLTASTAVVTSPVPPPRRGPSGVVWFVLGALLAENCQAHSSALG